MKILTNKKQQHLMTLICEAQKSAERNDFSKVIDFLAKIAGEVLTFEQLCVLAGESLKRFTEERSKER